jgi:Ca2+-binding EF-hand superfamily protein
MISSINSMSSAMSMVRQSPPPDRDVFQLVDADSDGLVSKTELETLATGIEEVTGTSIDVDEALTSFDTDQDGALSGEELRGLMSSIGFAPPGMSNTENTQAQGMQPPPPPPPSSEAVSSAYAQDTSEDEMEQLLALLKDQNGSDWEFSSIDVTG